MLVKGASLAVIDDASRSKEGTFWAPDVLTALQQLAAHHRRQFRNWQRPVKVIGITGTNGKTTTKELIRSVLSRKFNVLATEGNLNNQIGVPLTLLKVKPEHELGNTEMWRQPPDGHCRSLRHRSSRISDSSPMSARRICWVSVRSKASLLPRRNSTRVWLPMAASDLHRFFQPRPAEQGHHLWRAVPTLSARQSRDSLLALPLRSASTIPRPPEPIQVHTHLIGSYNAINPLPAAATVGRFFGVSIEEVGKAIESYEPQNMPFKMNNAPHKSVILGDMRELGDESQKEHGNVLNYLFTSGIQLDMIVLVGEEFCKAFKPWA